MILQVVDYQPISFFGWPNRPEVLQLDLAWLPCCSILTGDDRRVAALLRGAENPGGVETPFKVGKYIYI